MTKTQQLIEADHTIDYGDMRVDEDLVDLLNARTPRVKWRMATANDFRDADEHTRAIGEVEVDLPHGARCLFVITDVGTDVGVRIDQLMCTPHEVRTVHWSLVGSVSGIAKYVARQAPATVSESIEFGYEDGIDETVKWWFDNCPTAVAQWTHLIRRILKTTKLSKEQLVRNQSKGIVKELMANRIGDMPESYFVALKAHPGNKGFVTKALEDGISERMVKLV